MVLRLKARKSRSLPDQPRPEVAHCACSAQIETQENLLDDFGVRARYEICPITSKTDDAGWSSPVARQAHNLKVVGSNPTPATNINPRKYSSFRGYLIPSTECEHSTLGIYWESRGIQSQRMLPRMLSTQHPDRADRRRCAPSGKEYRGRSTGASSRPGRRARPGAGRNGPR